MSLLGILGIIVFILVYSFLCFYIGFNGWVWLQSTKFKEKYKRTYIFIIVFFSISVFLGQTSMPIFKWISGYWMAILGYSLIILPLANLVVFFLKRRYVSWVGGGVILIYAFIFGVGSFNAWNPVVRNYEITLPQRVEQQNNISILMASDLHLGSIVGTSHLQKLIDISIEEKPDIILLAGDIIDDHIEPFMENNMDEIMKELNAPLGVYAISGNHDFYGNDLSKLTKELETQGIQFLRDESLLINNQFYLVGRKDLAEGKRKDIRTLVNNLDKTKPIILLDHQPTELGEAEKNGVNLMLSGHTHNGQLAPANLITGMLFENDGGYLLKDTLHSFVSSGFGTWGPPLRIGSRSEVMVINLELGSK